MFKFWLDVEKDEEYDLTHTIQQLKQERGFARAVRQGIKLWVTLRNRDVSYLLELFEWVPEALGTPSGDVSGGNGQSDLKAQLDRLEQLFLSQNVPGKIDAARDLSRGMLPPPQEDDGSSINTTKTVLTPEAQFEKDYKDGKVGHWNLLIQMNIGLDGDTRSLPSEVVEYGVQRPTHTGPGPIPESQLADKHVYLLSGGDPPANSGGPKAMDVPQFEAPSFDDLIL